MKGALPGKSFALGSLIAIAVRGVITVVELLYVGAVTLLARRRGWSVLPDEPARAPDESEGDAADQLEGGQGEQAADQGAVPGDRGQR